jgi:DNA-binding HxlR family transcriptional regulator
MQLSKEFLQRLLFEGYHGKKTSPSIKGLLELFKDKWSFLVLLHLTQEKHLRFGELQRKLPLVSNKVLSKSLLQLEKAGLINRKEFSGFPLRVEYSCTITGRKFFSHLTALITCCLKKQTPSTSN